MWNRVKQNFTRDQTEKKAEAKRRLELFSDICASHADWVKAHRLFDEALGKDQVDYAIFVLEAAERKYQILLKSAKQQGLHRFQLPGEEIGLGLRAASGDKRRVE